MPSQPPPQAALERLTAICGEFSQGVAANGGGGRLGALLVHLIGLIIEALRSIASSVDEAAAPVEAGAGQPPAASPQNSERQVRVAPPSILPSSPRPRKPGTESPPAPEASEPHPGHPAITPAESRSFGNPKRQCARIAEWRRATTPPRPRKNRVDAPVGFARPFHYDIAT